MKKTFPIANGLALIITLAINYLSNTGIFNGNTMEIISDRYYNAFTPAGYAFSIWGLIYLGLLGFVLYTGRDLFSRKENDPELLKIGWWFVLSCAANSLWVITWLYDFTGISVLILIFLLVCLLKIIVNTRMELDYHPLKRYLFIYWPFAVYAGWLSVALVANIAAWLTKIDWNGWGLSEISWTIIILILVGLVNVAVVLTRNLREFALAGIWGIIAVSVSTRTNDGSDAIIYTCYVVAAVIFVFIFMNALKHKQRSLKRM